MTIKRAPEDFVVEEVLAAEVEASIADSPAAFALYRLEKEGLTTPEALARASRAFGVRASDFSFAGLKDKHARATQHVTLHVASRRGRLIPAEQEDGAREEKPEGAEPRRIRDGSCPPCASGPGWKLVRLGWLDQALSAPAIACNRFHILVRGLTREEVRDMDQAAELLRGPAGPRAVNYFGDQRFGSARHGRGFAAWFLIRGDFETALRLMLATLARKDRREVKEFKRELSAGWGRWRELLPRLRRCPERAAIERLAHSSGDFRAAFAALPYFLQQMCVYAYQSHLWNAVARRAVVEVCAPRGKVLAAESPYGELLFPSAAALPHEWAEMDLPLLGYKSELREPWRGIAERVLAEEEIGAADLRIPGLRRPFFGEEPRRFCVTAGEFRMDAPAPEEERMRRFSRRISFTLPRGAYATVLLRALGQ